MLCKVMKKRLKLIMKKKASVDLQLDRSGLSPIGGGAKSSLMKKGIYSILMDGDMQFRVEMLTAVENFVDIHVLLVAVKRLIKAGKFLGVGDSNVIQFRKECHDINFGVWGNLVSGRSKVEKAARVKELKNQIFNLIKTSHLIDSTRICWDEVQVTVLYTEPNHAKKQDPHTDYQLINECSHMELAWTAHLPIY